MRPIKPNTRRRSLWRTVLLAILAIVIGGAGTVFLLGVTKVIDFEKLAFWRTTPKPDHAAGWIPVPLSSQSIPAYTAITRNYLMNPKTGARTEKWESPKDVENLRQLGVITDWSKLVGRVTAREKPAGYFFRESDFEPVGTRPGVSAGVPPGKRGYTFNTKNLEGCVYQVKEGDRVDLMVSVPVDMPGAGRSGSSGASVLATPDTLLRPKRTLEIPLVQDGVVVSPVTARVVPITNSSALNGTTTRNMRVEEIVIAVAPAEVAQLDEAKALNHKLTCVARSGRPAPVPAPAAPRPAGGTGQGGMSQVLAALGKALLGKPSAAAADKAAPAERAKAVNPKKSESPAKDRVALDITPGSNPIAEVRYMVVQIGKERQFVLFNGPGNSPVVIPQDDGSTKAAPAAAPSAVPADAAEESE